MMGGERKGASETFPDNEEYDPVTDSWRILTPMRTPRHGDVAGTIDGVVYVAGGGPQGGTSFSALNEAFAFQSGGAAPAPGSTTEGGGAPSNQFTASGKASNPKKGKVQLFFNLPGPGLLTAGQAGVTQAHAVAAKGGALIKPTSVTAGSAGPVAILIRPAKAGKSILARKGKLRVSVKVTFTPSAARPARRSSRFC